MRLNNPYRENRADTFQVINRLETYWLYEGTTAVLNIMFSGVARLYRAVACMQPIQETPHQASLDRVLLLS